MEVILKLEDVLRLESSPTAHNLHELLHQHKLSVRPLLQNKLEIPAMSDDQLRKDMLFVPEDY